jgi:hypothetical protein
MMHTKLATRTMRQLAATGVGCLLLGSLAPAAGYAETLLAPPSVKPGQVVAWGGPADLQAVLTPPVGLDDAVAVAASETSGSYSNLALRADGTVIGWGLNPHGEATPPAGLDNVVAVDVGAGFSVALKSDGSVVTWGTNESGQLDVPADLGPVTAVSAGGYLAYRGFGVPEAVCGYALALHPDGTVTRWGQDAPGLGCDLIDQRMDPPPGLDNVVAVSAGARQSLALRADGTVVAWGTGVSGGLDGTPPDQWSDVVAISAGDGHSLGLRSDGTVLAYGIWGESGPPQASGVSAISAANIDVFLHRDGTITTYRGGSSTPTGSGFQAVAAGYDYGLAIEPPVEEPAAPLLGSAEVQPSVDSNPSGTAEAFQYTASRSVTARFLHVYLDERNDADQVIVGVYNDAEGEPGRLLSRGQSSQLVAGAWNAIPIADVDVKAGERYWLALLSPRGSGAIQFRDLSEGEGGPTALSAQGNLTARWGLPTTWRTGCDYANSPASIYLS